MSKQTISAEKLCLLTGVTDRRHRQIAKLGYFPPPIKSEYQLTPTLQGMFKYYRELGEYRKNKREEIDAEKHRKLKLDNDHKAELLTDKAELIKQVSPMLLKFRNDVYAALENEAPRGMSGMGLSEGRIIGRRMAADLLLKLQNVFKAVK